MTTRHERRATLGRRLELATVAGAVLLTVVLGQLAPERAAGGAGRTASVSDSPDSTGTSGTSGPSGDDSRPGAERPSGSEAGSEAGSDRRGNGGRAVRPLPRSVPERLRIARTDTDAAVFTADTRADGSPPVPPAARVAQVAWSRSGPAPGERGPALLVGRLDAVPRKGAGDEGTGAKGTGDKATGAKGGRSTVALGGLDGLRPGARIAVRRKDDRTAHFEVTRVERYAQVRYPDKRVYGATDDPQLRLVADAAPAKKGEPARLGIVVSARLVSSTGR